MKSIFIIFCVAALANAMTVNRQQQQVPPQQVGQGGQHQARQEQDNQPPIPSQQQMQGWQNRQQQQVGQGGQQQARQGQDNQPPIPGQQQMQGWQNRQQQQVVKGGQQQVGQRQDVQPPVPGQQQMQGWQNRQQQSQCLEMDCESGWLPMRQQQQQVRQGGQKQIGQRQDVQPQIPAQQQFQWGQNRQQQKCLTVDCVLERFPPLPQLQTQDFQNRQQQLIPPQRIGQGGQQQVGQRQIDQIPITGQQQQQRQFCKPGECEYDL
uniref:Uncharacterized protein n=1 Tax=Anopheles atroparvus TaxID=41427 RepID=A0AAG5CVA3_ANOAO